MAHQFKTQVLHVTLACDLTQVRVTAQRVQKFLKANGCEEHTRADCELAVVEGCNNAIKHTRSLAEPEQVAVDVTVSRREIELRITDHGPGFTWPPDIRLPAPDHETGRGLYLIHQLMDSVCYIRGNKRNVLVLRRSRSGG